MLLREAIRARRSVRRYAGEMVSLEQLLDLVDCGRHAPTAGNLQAWEFIVVREVETIQAIISLAPGISAGAAAVIAICADLERARRKAGEGGELYGLLDACFAAENILLAATDAGLGACVVRSFHRPAVGQLLGLPERVEAQLLVTLGYPVPPLPRGPRRRDLSDIVHLGRWSDRLAGAEARAEGPAPGAGSGFVSRPAAQEEAPPPEAGASPEREAHSEPEASALRSALRRHLSYLAASAHGLLAEPPAYGPYRLADALGRLIMVMGECGLVDRALLEVLSLVEERKLDVMDHPDEFGRMLDEVLRRLNAG